MLINFQPFFLPVMGLFMCSLTLFSSCGNSQEQGQNTEIQKDSTQKSNLSVEQLNGMIIQDPENSQLYYERALANYEYGDLASALKDFDKTIELEPDFASAFHDRGICRLELDMLDKALEDFNKAIELDSNYFEAYFNRALIYDAQNKKKEALADLSTAISINPEFGDAYYNRGVYLLNTDREKACADFKKASELGIEEAGLTLQQYCK